MKISFIVPAFNEEKLIAECVAALRAACAAHGRQGLQSEIIVVDNNSTDRTSERAETAGARVVFEPVNQIARARNRGARDASGDWFIFVDADSLVSAELISDVLARAGAGDHAGGGATVVMTGAPRWLRFWVGVWNLVSRAFGWAAGAFIWCRADAFREIGGFNEELYASEEIDFSMRLRRWARARRLRFTILARHPLRTSGRKAELYSWWELSRCMLRLLLHPRKAVRSREHLDIWYGGKR